MIAVLAHFFSGAKGASASWPVADLKERETADATKRESSNRHRLRDFVSVAPGRGVVNGGKGIGPNKGPNGAAGFPEEIAVRSWRNSTGRG